MSGLHSISLDPITAQEPCGPNLEYDTEYVLLLSKLQPKEGAQYGDFVDAPTPIHWGDVQTECTRLLARSKDIALLIIYTRCLLRGHQAEGLQAGLELLLACLERYPEHINPPAESDGEIDTLVRANALSAIVDPEGLLGDFREMVLVKNTALRLQMRDIERAFLVPRPADALAVESVVQQLQDLLVEGHPQMQALYQAHTTLEKIQSWGQEHLGGDAPNYTAFFKLLAPLQRAEVMQFALQTSLQEGATTDISVNVPPVPQPVESAPPVVHPAAENLSMIHDPRLGRKQALEDIRKVRVWFELHEPSSPVVLFLKQAERSVGKKFADVVQSIPTDLLDQWDRVSDEVVVKD